MDKNDQLDYLIDLDVVVYRRLPWIGPVFLDNDGNDKYSAAADEALIGATVMFENETIGYRVEATTTEDGYEILGISPCPVPCRWSTRARVRYAA